MPKIVSSMWDRFLTAYGYCEPNPDGSRPCTSGKKCSRCHPDGVKLLFADWLILEGQDFSHPDIFEQLHELEAQRREQV